MEILPKEIDFKQMIENSIDSLKYMDDADKVHENMWRLAWCINFIRTIADLAIIFNNIIANAAVSYRDREKRIFHSYWSWCIFSWLSLNFRTNGIGIEEFKEKIFKMLGSHLSW